MNPVARGAAKSGALADSAAADSDATQGAAARPWLARPELHSIAWQGLGSAATLAAALWVSWRMGLAAQGEFGLAKSWFDAAAAIAALGLPQGLLHLHYRLKVPVSAIRSWLLRWGLALAVGSAVCAMWLLMLGLPLAAAVVASLPFAVGHLLARSILLAQRGVVVFGGVTALPALLLLAGVVAIGWHPQPRFEALLLITVLLSGSASMVLAWRSCGAPTVQAWPRAQLWQVSLQSWLQAALGALLAAGLLSTVAWSGHVGDELGAASLSLQVYQVFAVAAGYLAPVLYDRLARQDQPTLRAWPRLARQGSMGLLALAVVGVLASWVDPRSASWLLPAALMLPAGIAAVAGRVAGTVLLARSAYAELSVQALWRLLLSIGLTWLALHWLPAAAAVALALLVVEGATWWRAITLGRKGRA